MGEQKEKRVINSINKLESIELNEFGLNLFNFSIPNLIDDEHELNLYNHRFAAFRVTDIIFSDITFKEFDFSKLKFEHCEFNNCTFIYCAMISTDFNYCKINNCVFKYSVMTRSAMVGCDVFASNFDMICFVGAQIINSIFVGNSINRCSFNEGRIVSHDDSESKLPTNIRSQVPFYGNSITQSSFNRTEINFDIFAVSDFSSRERLESGNVEYNSLSSAKLNDKA